jgi:hypothetical protein
MIDKTYIKKRYGQLSWILVPISLLIIFYKKELIKYFSYIFLCIAIIGTIDTYLVQLKYSKIKLFILLSYIFHLLLLYPLINIKEYIQINNTNYLLGIIALLIINYLPYWPYVLTRDTITSLIFIIYLILTFISLINIY